MVGLEIYPVNTDEYRYLHECGADYVTVFQETYEPDRKDVYIVKEVSGQGAVYDTWLCGNEPCGYEGGRSVIDMGWMPVVVTPNEFRDGIMHAMD